MNESLTTLQKIAICNLQCLCALILLAGCGGGFGTVTPLNGGGGNGGNQQGDKVTLTGLVKDNGTGLPLPNALVIFGGNRTSTDADGKFNLLNVTVPKRQLVLFSRSVKAARRLQAAQTFTGALTVSLDTYETFFDDNVTIQAGGTLNKDISLIPAFGTGTLTGFVRESGSNKAIVDALVQVPPPPAAGGMKGRTADDGSFQISGAPLGRQTVRVEASGYTRTEMSANVAVGVNQSLTVLLFKSGNLIPVSGKVLDENREGIVGATVSIGNKSTQTIAGGAFTLNAPAGTQPVVINAAGFESLAQNIEIIGGLPPLEFVLAVTTTEPPSTPFTVRGTVTDQSGNPVSGARVTAFEQPDNAARDIVLTRSEGRYRLFIAPGFYLIRVEKSGFQTAERTVTVPTGGQIVDNFNFTLVAGGSPSRVLSSSEPSKARKRLRRGKG